LVERIHQALTRALKNPGLTHKVEAAGTELRAGSAEEVMQWTQRDTAKWRRVIQEAKISLE
jgi:tripartite-type tricarboxylate transporter receptor subunit TctC